MEILRRYCFNRTTMSRGNKGWNSSNPTKRRRRRNKVWQEFSNFENGVIGCEELRIILFRPESPPKHRMGCFAFIRANWEREREGRGSSPRDGESGGLFELKLTRYDVYKLYGNRFYWKLLLNEVDENWIRFL